MASGEIARNSAGYGGGVFLNASEFEQSDGCIGSNKALLIGGGCFIDENSTLQLRRRRPGFWQWPRFHGRASLD